MKLNKPWEQHMVSLPETSMGYQKVIVTLKDGQTLEGTVAESNILYAHTETIRFTIEDIADIQLDPRFKL